MPPHTPTLLPKHIYAEELISRGHGSPLWYPEPSRYGEIHVGDVGFLHDSSFYRLFNAMCEPTDSRNSLGVPKGFKPLKIPDHLIHLQTVLPAGPICAESTNYRSTSAGASVGSPGMKLNAKISYSFSSNSNRGALAILGSPGEQRAVVKSAAFPKYMVDNHKSWVKFVLKLGYDLQPNEIIFVSACVKTTEWAIAAFGGGGRWRDLSFSASVGNYAAANFSRSVVKEGQLVDHRSGPTRNGQGYPPQSEDPPPNAAGKGDMPKDQCLFMKYYKVQTRAGWARQRQVTQWAQDLQGVPENRVLSPPRPFWNSVAKGFKRLVGRKEEKRDVVSSGYPRRADIGGSRRGSTRDDRSSVGPGSDDDDDNNHPGGPDGGRNDSATRSGRGRTARLRRSEDNEDSDEDEVNSNGGGHDHDGHGGGGGAQVYVAQEQALEIPTHDVEPVDPLDHLVAYIFEVSAVDKAVVCHQDLYALFPTPNDWPGDDLSTRLRQIRPEVTIDQGTGSILIRLPPPTTGQIVRIVAEEAPSTRPRQKVKQVKVRVA